MCRKSRRNGASHRNTHHIFPRSRNPELKNAKWNQISIDRRQHDLYHQLFGNRTPQEIMDFLTEYFWGGRLEIRVGTPDGTAQG